MKKILSAIIVVMLLSVVLVMPASAAGNGSISMTSATAKRGDTVTLNVKLNSNPGLVTMTIRVTYDTNVLELVSVSDPKLLIGSQLNTNYGSPYTISWVDGATISDNKKTGTMATFKFKVKSNAAIGDTKVTLQFVDSFDTNYNENTFAATSGKVTVTCSNHTYGSYTKENATTHKRTCTACGYVESVNHTWDKGTVTKAASCKETGEKSYTCTGCGATKTETVSKTNDHKYGDWKATKEATCKEQGTQERTCSSCQKVETKSIAALGHKLGAYTVTKEATCTEDGKKTATCSVCKETVEEKVSAAGHKYGSAVVVKEATETETGLKTRTCSACNDKKEEIIPKLSVTTTRENVTTTTNNVTTTVDGETTTATDVDATTNDTTDTTTTDTADATTTVEDNTVATTVPSDNEDGSGNNTVWIIGGIAAAVVIIGAVIAIVAKKKK